MFLKNIYGDHSRAFLYFFKNFNEMFRGPEPWILTKP